MISHMKLRESYLLYKLVKFVNLFENECHGEVEEWYQSCLAGVL